MDIIKNLKSDKRIFGSCPSCGEDFRLSDSILFPAKGPMPPAVAEIIQDRRTDLKDRQFELKRRIERLTSHARRTVEAVNVGNVVEQIAPSFTTFAFSPPDCRPIFKPIDYVIFNGVSKSQNVDSITFLEVKSGRAVLNSNQKSVQRILDAGRLSFKVV